MRKQLKKIMLRLAAGLAAAGLLTAATCAATPFTRRGAIPILMYHHITEDASACNSITITRERLREDLTYLKEHGYTALLPADLLRIHAGEQPMPERPVCITFDDGYESNYTLAYPLLRETGMRAVISVIAGNLLQDGAERHGSAPPLTWGECREMYESGLVDIGLHTYALHNNDTGGAPHPDGHDGIQRLKGETHAEYDARVGGDLHRGVSLIEERVGNDCVYFSFPFGAGDPWFGALQSREGLLVTTTTVQRTASVACRTDELPRWRITMERSVASLLG